MQLFLYIATAAGIFLAAHSGGEWEIVRHTLVNQALTSIVVAEDLILVVERTLSRRRLLLENLRLRDQRAILEACGSLTACLEPGDVYWAASDVGWVVGHSYICYGPLIHGNTTIVFEGKPVGTPVTRPYGCSVKY